MATDLAKPILEKLMDATIAQSRYICCFSCIVEEFEKEKETLKAKRTTVGEYVREANRRGESIRNDVTFWQEKADKLIQESTETKATCFFGCCPNCKWQYSRGKKLANRTEDIKRLVDSNFESVGILHGIADVEYYSSQDYISFKSRELKYKELLNALTNGNNYMIGLHGMGGTGKTTLAKEVGKELKKSEKFDHVIDTIVSSTPNITKIQDDIAGPLGLTLKDCTEFEKPRRLWSRLTNGEKILIIIDDVWGDINFEEIGIPKKDNHNGCKILITTRNLRICNSMGCDEKIQLELLPEEDAWMLFKNHAGLSDSSPKIILDNGHEITKECKGLPMAIAIIASSLKGEERSEEWSVALKSLQKSISQHGNDEIFGEIYKCLRYSYDNMKNKTSRELFLLCSVFREDEEIFDNILTRLSIGVGLLEKIDEDNESYSYNACRSEVAVAKNKLIDSCLLLKTTKGWVKMHDLVREMALWISNKEIQAMNICNKNQKSLVEKAKNLKYLLCEGKGIDVFSFKFDGSKLKILIVYLNGDWYENENENVFVEVPNLFFENMIGLRVLYFSNKTYQNTTLSLPQSIQSLTNIRSLILERFVLGDISILRNLHGLETLDLVQCVMDELPHEIAELQKLKLLHLHLCKIQRNNPFKVIENCSSLEELYFICDYPNPRLPMHKKVTLPKLKRFRIVDSGLPFYFRATQSVMNSLYVSKIDDLFCSETFKHLLQITRNLNLFELQEEWRNLIPSIILPKDEGALNLCVLRLTCISQLHCLIDTKHIDSSHIQNVFSMLVLLELKEMKKLKELCSGPLPFELLKSLETLFVINCVELQGKLFKSKLILCNLKSLELSSCPKLVSLFQLSTAQSLVMLEDLSISNCEKLKSIITEERVREDLGEEIVDGGNDNKTIGSMFTNLKSLCISRCPQLDFILWEVAIQDVPKLEVIEIRDCVELKYIFGPCQHKHEEHDDFIFITLKQMVLEGLPNFVNIFPKCDQSMGSYVKRWAQKESRSYSKDGSETQKESDSIKCNIFPWTRKYRHRMRSTRSTKSTLTKDQLQDGSLSSVHDSKVYGHEEMIVDLMRIQWRGPGIYFTLQNITELTIGNCEEVKVIFSASMLRSLPQLHSLSIFECNGLKHIIDEDARNHEISFFPELKVLVIKKCKKLKCIFPMSTSKMLPKLELLVIKEATLLEEVFGCESDQCVEIPNLKIAIFVELPSLCKGINRFETIKDRLVQNCPKLSLTSTSRQRMQQISNDGIEGSNVTNRFIKCTLHFMLDDLDEDSKAQQIRNQNSTANDIDVTEFFSIQYIHDNIEEHNQHEEGIESSEIVSVETQTTKTLEAEQQAFVEKVPGSEIPSTASSTDSELIGIPSQTTSDISLNKTHSLEIKKSVEEGTTSSQIGSILGQLVTSECKMDQQEDGEEQIAIPSFSDVNIEPATTKGVGNGDFQETSKSVIKTNGPGFDVTNYTKDKLQEWRDALYEDSEAISSGSELSSLQVNTNIQSSDANIAEYNQHENGTESNEFIFVETQTKETLQPGFNPADEDSSSSSSQDEHEVQGNKGSNSSIPTLSEALENTSDSSPKKYHIEAETNKINNNKGIPKYTTTDIDDCLRKLDDDPFALLDFMQREVSVSSKQLSKTKESTTSETLASALDELRALAFHHSMLENIGDVKYREKVEAVIRKLDEFPNNIIDQELDNRIKSFVELFGKAAQVCEEQCSTVELIKQADAEKKSALEKLQRTKDEVFRLDEAIERRYKPKLKGVQKRMKKLREELDELCKDKAKIESANTECSSKKAELIESAKCVSNTLGETFKHVVDLEMIKAKHDADFEALRDPYKKMVANPPF